MSSRLNLVTISNAAGMSLHLECFDVKNEIIDFSSIDTLVHDLHLEQQ